MITTHLMGGLGNYMFQIAVAVSIADENRDVTIFSKVGIYEPHGKIEKYESWLINSRYYFFWSHKQLA